LAISSFCHDYIPGPHHSPLIAATASLDPCLCCSRYIPGPYHSLLDAATTTFGGSLDPTLLFFLSMLLLLHPHSPPLFLPVHLWTASSSCCYCCIPGPLSRCVPGPHPPSLAADACQNYRPLLATAAGGASLDPILLILILLHPLNHSSPFDAESPNPIILFFAVAAAVSVAAAAAFSRYDA
jgi:hypothetical protein